MKTFNVGDLVYCPKIGVGVYILERSDVEYGLHYKLKIDTDRFGTFTSDGRYIFKDLVPSLFKVSVKNHKRLTKLYGVEFEVGGLVV